MFGDLDLDRTFEGVCRPRELIGRSNAVAMAPCSVADFKSRAHCSELARRFAPGVWEFNGFVESNAVWDFDTD
jgi:hypothetical protein